MIKIFINKILGIIIKAKKIVIYYLRKILKKKEKASEIFLEKKTILKRLI